MYRILACPQAEIHTLEVKATPSMPSDASIRSLQGISALMDNVRTYVRDSLDGKPKQAYGSDTFGFNPDGLPFTESLRFVSDFEGSESSLVIRQLILRKKKSSVQIPLVTSGVFYINVVAQLIQAVSQQEYVLYTAQSRGIGLSGEALSRYRKLEQRVKEILDAHQFTAMSVEDAMYASAGYIGGVERHQMPFSISGVSSSTVESSPLTSATTWHRNETTKWIRSNPEYASVSQDVIDDLVDAKGVSSWLVDETPVWRVNAAAPGAITTDPLTRALARRSTSRGEELLALFQVYTRAFSSGQADSDKLAELMRHFSISVRKMGFSVTATEYTPHSLEDYLIRLSSEAYESPLNAEELRGVTISRAWRDGLIHISAEVRDSPELSDDQLKLYMPYLRRPFYEWPSSLRGSYTFVNVDDDGAHFVVANSFDVTVFSDVHSHREASEYLMRSSRSEKEKAVETHLNLMLLIILHLANKAKDPAVLKNLSIAPSQVHGVYARYLNEHFSPPEGVLVGGYYG
jgi:hypothetical protein